MKGLPVISLLLAGAALSANSVDQTVSSSSSALLQQMHSEIEAAYNVKHGPVYGRPSSVDHPRRCALILPVDAQSALAHGVFANQTKGLPVLVSSMCIGIDSLGNYLGNYLENVACAQQVGIPYLGIAKVYEPRTRDASNSFLDELPTIIPPPPATITATTSTATALSSMKLRCRCPGSCHESDKGAWLASVPIIRSLVRKALSKVIESVSQNASTIVAKADLIKHPIGTALPLVPDVSVHYRCGDNFVGHYGFLPFAAITKYINKHSDIAASSPRTIYVYAEARGRKTISVGKQHLAQKCDVILRGLYEHLSASFPQDTVLIRRGDDPYIDMARLAFSKVTICSVSTFCLWPAIASESNHVYFPVTPLVAKGNVAVLIREGFHFMKDVQVVLGGEYALQPVAALMGRLTVATKT